MASQPSSKSAASRPAPGAGVSLPQQALEAQAALLPYALIAFVVGLPIFIWAGSYSPRAHMMLPVLLSFAVAWGVFYVVVNWLKTPAAADLDRRARVHILSGLMWAGACANIAIFADSAGPVREPLLLVSVAASALCIFFTATWLPAILIVAPAIAAGPMIAVYARPDGAQLAPQAAGAIALALALVLILNRILRRQFGLAAEREALIAERARQMDEQKRLAQSKSDLIATLSQEIRSGLTGVAHVLAAAAGGGRAAPTREQLAAALESANELIAVLDTTLDSETAEAGRLSVEVRPFDPVALAREALGQVRPAASAKGLEIGLHVDPELVEAETGAALADPARVRQILLALLSNAIRFTVRGRVEVRLEPGQSGRLGIEIADTGPGLSPEELAEAFLPFHRIARTSAGVPGAGLGLSLSRQLARLMGGEIEAHSAVGVGSRFRLEIAYDPSAPRERAGPPEATPDMLRPQRRTLRVLMAEDDSLDAAMLRSVLEKLGHKVVHAADARRALDLAKSCELDLAVVGGRMAHPDGEPLVAALKALDGRTLRVVAVIGGDAEEALECSRAGADVVLRRPVGVATAARAIAQAAAGAAQFPRRVA
ncbi:MAG: hybrid sensor histidine kinase/response regulator [Phenylobacterium sp.]|uniref:hybrid sensor histidine kinase/response regulator n=1 Tax=Phenylobacterium sp. TaxID=1871053 RepID=UPI002A361831|nr:hybrid sensor histidine kinase/response regulator [Phenylobacterium sp.]MDX9998823.1 hybrid sensor histidine kinase/response regulator [Phenylobacterium sp.]